MSSLIAMPDLRAIVEPLLGTSYETYDCWELVRLLFQRGFGVDFAAEQMQAAEQFMEVWWHEDPRDPLSLLQPWDLYLLARAEPWPITRHVGVVVDPVSFVHARVQATGVALERCRRWQPKLIQIARWRQLA